MLITRKSPLTGKEHTRDIPITEAQLRQWKISPLPLSHIAPQLNADEREFLISGLVSKDWLEIAELKHDARCFG